MGNLSNMNINPHIHMPSYDRRQLKTKIVHLGFGAFHRAHQSLYTHDLLSQTGGDWGTCVVSLFSGDKAIQKMRAQNHLYSVIEKGAHETRIKVVGSISDALHPRLDGVQKILDKMADPQVTIVSLTITEKGYCVDPVTGHLDTANELIKADLANPKTPSSAIGYLVQALSLRRLRKISPFTVLSCDNLQGNGYIAKTAIVELARKIDPSLSDWIQENARFPSTMVDRIVPASTEETHQNIRDLLGVDDPCGVECEPFRQWVIEDNFVTNRPCWDTVGAQFVSDVRPYEEMKLRMLNGSHSFLAYLGYLAGYNYISETMRDNGFRDSVFNLMTKEQATSLSMPKRADVTTYANKLMERFSNQNLRHRTWQIAMDGSQKIPQRLGGSLRHHLQHHSGFRWIALGIAGWIRYVSGVDEKGQDIEVRDPLARQLKEIHTQHKSGVEVVRAILALDAIFPPEIGKNPVATDIISQAYESLLEKGARVAVSSL